MGEKRRVPGSTLKVDVDKQRAFQQGGRGKLRRKPRSRLKSFPGSKRLRKDWRPAVFARYGPRCVVTGLPAEQAHHVVALNVILRAHHLTVEQRHQLAYDPENGAPVTADAHERHENASRRITRSELRLQHVEWAERHGFGWYLDRIYPVESDSGPNAESGPLGAPGIGEA